MDGGNQRTESKPRAIHSAMPAGENFSETSTLHNGHITNHPTSSVANDPLILNELQDSITGIDTISQNNPSFPSSPTRGDHPLRPVEKTPPRAPRKRHIADKINSVPKRRAYDESPKTSPRLKDLHDVPTPGADAMAISPPPPNDPTETHSPVRNSPDSYTSPASAPTPGGRHQQTPPADPPSTPPRNLPLPSDQFVTPEPWADQYPYNQPSDSDSSPELIPLSDTFVPVSVELEDPFIDHDNPPRVNRGLDKMDEGV